jgi:cytochrome c553
MHKLPASPLLPALTALLLTIAGGVSVMAFQTQKPHPGERIYRQQCASCHGAKGEGAKAYPKPLTGTQSVEQLADFISKNMPPGPKKCSVPDSKQVAAYIHAAFYSPIAQARNKPPRIELSRLTTRQYRNAVTDLIGSFRPAPPQDQRRGLRGEYFRSRTFRNNEKQIERIDPVVDFDFGREAPAKEGFDPRLFSIRWEGSVLVPETGEYEFVLRTQHAAALWLNDMRKPLIDAWVKSGNDTEFRGSLFLLGGRAYPLRLEFSKAKQGVDDSNQTKNQPVAPASISLLWKPPHRVVEPIPQRSLIPSRGPEVYVVSTPFPADDRSMGYERGTSVSRAWDDATTEAAFAAGDYITEKLPELAGVSENAPDRRQKLRSFCRLFVERAFRRPLTDDLEKIYVSRPFDTAPDLDTAVKRVVLLTLKSPRFLYRELESDKPDAYTTASRLSFALWDSLPDRELLRAAAEGQLSTYEQVRKQAERMGSDPRTWFKLREFLLQWLKVDLYPDLVKNPKSYPGFDEAAASDLRTSLELSLQESVWSERSDYRELMLSKKVYLNGRLAKIYGVNLPPDAGFQPVLLNAEDRAGVLTHPYILSSFAYLDASSPIHRGVLVSRSFLGRVIQPPPVAVAPVAPDLQPNLTTRQRVEMQTKPPACMSCHALINPLGFPLERFDAIGKLRTQEKGKPIDSSGSYLARNGKTVSFSNAVDLGRFLSESDEAHAAFIEKLFQYTTKQPIRAYGPSTITKLQQDFRANQFNIRKILQEMVAVSASGS